MDAAPLPHLETFAKAAELGSFTGAAKALELSQAAVSQRIQALEQALGTSLFHRKGGHVLLTDAGQRLYAYAQRIEVLHQEARQAVTGQKVRLSGELMLAASSVPGEHLLPAILAEFHRKYPRVQVKVTIADSSAVLDQVEHGRCNVGLVGGKSESSNLSFRSFACDHLVLVVPSNHSWRRRKQVSLEQLCQQPLILREAGSGSRWCLERALRSANKTAHDLQVAMELGSNEAIKEAVLRGMGVAVLSIHTVQKEIERGQLHGLTVQGLSLEREMFVVWDRRRALPMPAHLFLDFLEPCPHSEQKQ